MTGSSASADHTLARWVATTPAAWLDNMPDQAAVSDQVATSFVDTLGCALAARAHPVRTRVAQLHSGATNSWARPTTALGSAPAAALINATAAHAMDFDDVLVSGRSHASAVLVPTVLAVGDTVGATGRQIAAAYIVGLEVMHVIALASGLIDYTAGWHTTATHGTFGAAAAASRLLGLDTQRTAHALSIAHSLSAGSKRQFGTSTKPLHAGLAARNGIDAAYLAHAGIDAAQSPIFGAGGYLTVHAPTALSDEPKDLDSILASVINNNPAGISSLWRKPYPCCASTHAAIDATLAALPRQHAPNLTAIDVTLNPLDASNLPYPLPQSIAEARFSMPYCLAAAARDGHVTESAFAPASASHGATSANHLWAIPDDLEEIRRLVTVTVDDGYQPGADPSGHITFTFTHGASRTVELGQPLGHPARPLDAGTVLDKLTPHAPSDLCADITRLSDLTDIRQLCQQLSEIPPRAQSATRH